MSKLIGVRFQQADRVHYFDLGDLDVSLCDSVMVETDSGITGFGYGGPATAYVVERHLPKLLLGEDPFQVERLWDIMWRGTLYYGRKGVVVHAISAVDDALWDIVGMGRLNAKVDSTRMATGEHEYTRYGFELLARYKAADIW